MIAYMSITQFVTCTCMCVHAMLQFVNMGYLLPWMKSSGVLLLAPQG